MTESKVMKAMKEKAVYGQFHTENCTQGGWFIWLMDAVDVAKKLMEKRRR